MISLRLSEPDAPDVRAGSDSYTEAAIAAIHGSSSAVHTGGVGAGTAIASRLYELALASAEPIGEGAELLTPAVLARMGRDLAECGETVWLASLEGAMPATWLSHCNEYEVRGGHRLESWMYRLQMTGPSATATLSAPSSEVVHVRLHASRSVPWRGRSPLYVAGQTGALAAMVNQALVEEYSIGSKLIAPMPAKVQGFGQSELNALRQAFSNRKYRFLFPPTTQQIGTDRPQTDWKPQRFNPQYEEAQAHMIAVVTRSVAACYGVTSALSSVSDTTPPGPSLREAWRQFVANTVEPFGRLISAEVSRVFGGEVKLSFKRLAAIDLAARARALGILTNKDGPNIPIAEAREIVGL